MLLKLMASQESSKINEKIQSGGEFGNGSGKKRQFIAIPSGVIPIAHEQMKAHIGKIPLLQKVSPIIRRFLMEMPHAHLERLELD